MVQSAVFIALKTFNTKFLVTLVTIHKSKSLLTQLYQCICHIFKKIWGLRMAPLEELDKEQIQLSQYELVPPISSVVSLSCQASTFYNYVTRDCIVYLISSIDENFRSDFLKLAPTRINLTTITSLPLLLTITYQLTHTGTFSRPVPPQPLDLPSFTLSLRSNHLNSR